MRFDARRRTFDPRNLTITTVRVAVGRSIDRREVATRRIASHRIASHRRQWTREDANDDDEGARETNDFARVMRANPRARALRTVADVDSRDAREVFDFTCVSESESESESERARVRNER